MRYVIIGGSGFVGRELIDLLIRKGKREIIDIDLIPTSLPVQYVQQDITEEIRFRFLPDDVVVHLAANQYHNKAPKKGRQAFFESVNVTGTQNILRKMAKDGAHQMVFFITDMVYGKPLYLPVDTGHVQNPFGYYGRSKKAAETVCEKYRQKGVNITVFRPRMIIGKGRLGILVKLFKLIEHSLPVPMIGSGQNCYQMVSVQDCAAAIDRAIQHNLPNKAYNLGSENPPTVRELLRRVISSNRSKSILIPTWGKAVKATLGMLGKLGLEVMYKEQYMIADEHYIIDISETKRELDWTPQFNDADMMTAAFREYQRLKSMRMNASH